MLIYAIIIIISFAGRTQGMWIQIRIRMDLFFRFDLDPYLHNVRGSGSGSRRINLYLNEIKGNLVAAIF